MLRDHVQFGSSNIAHLTGKGRKERDIPLWLHTARSLKEWFRELENNPSPLAFPSARGHQLSRNGVDNILKKAAARADCPSLSIKGVHPHAVRHTTGTHLLQSGVDINVIALWLGHESIETTHLYVEADLAIKERALQKLAPPGSRVRRFTATDQVLSFLTSL